MTMYQVRISPRAQADLDLLPGRIAAAAVNFIRIHLRQHPDRAGVKLRGNLKDHFLAQRGQYRIIYKVDSPAGIVDILQILSQH